MSAVFGSVAVGAVAPQALFANVPANSVPVGYQVFFTDWGANGTLARSNGTRWLPVGGRVLIKHFGAAVTGIVNSEAIVLQSPAMPLGSIQAGDQFRIEADGLTKSGTTDTMNGALRMGTAGTTSDTAFSSPVLMTAANQTGAALFACKIVSNTTIVRAGPATGASGLYGGSSASAAPAATTISDVSANVMFLSFGIASAGVTNTVGMQEGSIWQIVG